MKIMIMMILTIIIIVIIIAIMIMMIKIILIIAVVIIINISFEPGDFSIGSTTEVILVIYTSYTRITFNFFSSIFTSDHYDYY